MGEKQGEKGRFGRVTSAATARWAMLQKRYRWLQHVLAAWALTQRNNANQYAAAITYFSFLALFPLLLLAVSVAGFVLHAHPAAEHSFFDYLGTKVSGGFGDTVQTALKTAIDNRSGVGAVGLLGVLLTGLGWIGNLRSAIDAVWGRTPPKRNVVMSRVANLLVLGGLGVSILVSLGLTAVGTAVTDQVVRAAQLDSVPGLHYLLKVVPIALAVAGDMIIFWWLLIRLPEVSVPRSVIVRGTLLAAAGFEVLKIVGTFTIARSAHSPTAGPFASIIAVLVWIQLVARYMLFSCAWIATANVSGRAEPYAGLAGPGPGRDEDDARGAADADGVDASLGSGGRGPAGDLSPAAVGASLLGAGAAAGAAATWVLTRSGRKPPPP